MGVLPDWMVRRDIKITPFAEGIKREGVISYGLDHYGYSIRLGYKFRVFTNSWCGVVDPKNYDPKAFVEVDLTPLVHDWSGPGVRDQFGVYVCHNCLQKCYDPAAFMQPCVTPPNHVLIPPNSFVLGESLEEFDIPRDVLCIVVGKSTYARCGIVANLTPGEPEWKGKWTLELSNTTPLPAKVYAGEGICQCIFLRTDGFSEATYLAMQELLNIHDMTDFRRQLAIAQNKWNKIKPSCVVSYKDKDGKYQAQTGMTNPKVDGGAR